MTMKKLLLTLLIGGGAGSLVRQAGAWKNGTEVKLETE